MLVDAIIFDLDGTLWNAEHEILAVWNQVIAREGAVRPPLTLEELERLLGHPMDVIARRVFPDLPEAAQMDMLGHCMEEENAFLYEHGGRLYPELRETLSILKRKYKLCIVSNCQSGYIEAFLHAHELESLFDDFLCFGDNGFTKGDNIRCVIERNGLQHAVYVGDTIMDFEAAQYADTPFIHAAYGFGQAADAKWRIQAFSDLPQLMEA